MKVILVNTPECPCLYTHYHACMEFIAGFEADQMSSANTLEECAEADILVLSSHKIDLEFLNRLNTVNPDGVYILWYYHSVLQNIPFRKFILTSEYYHKEPRRQENKPLHAINMSIPNYVPLMLRANESPDMIGKYNKTYELDGCFMGTPYKQGWVARLPNIVYHDIQRSGCLPYNARRDIYLKSKIAFGFSDDGNILNYHPTQRIFEGMAYGCVVLSDNEAAEDLTGGIVVYTPTYQDFIDKYNYYLSHPEECRIKEKQGYEWVKQFGTNRYAAKLFLDKISTIFA